MALDLHTNVKVLRIIDTEILDNEILMLGVEYKVYGGRKIYALWALPEDLAECHIFPISVSPKGNYIVTYDNQYIYNGDWELVSTLVQKSNERWYTNTYGNK